MKEKNQNMIIGALGVAMLLVGLLGYTGTLEAISQATITIETKGVIQARPPPEPSDVQWTTDSTTEFTILYYWQEDMSGWEQIIFDGREAIIDATKPIHFGVGWRNIASYDIKGHVELTVIRPDGGTASPSAVKSQDVSAPPDDGLTVQFEPVETGQAGHYQLSIEITGSPGITPDGYFTVNGIEVTEDAVITLHTNDLTFVLHPTQAPELIDRVQILIDEYDTGHDVANLVVTEQTDGTWEIQTTLEDGKYTVIGYIWTTQGINIKAMHIVNMEAGAPTPEISRAPWLLAVFAGLVMVAVAVGRQLLRGKRLPVGR